MTRTNSLLRHPTLGLFEKRIEGDDALMELARLRFRQTRMGAEMHAGTPEQLRWCLAFRPCLDAPVVVHLPRDFHLLQQDCSRRIVQFASNFAGSISGLVLHNHADMAVRTEDFRRAAQELDSRLQSIERCPTVFIEYATGLDFNLFCRFFDSVQALLRITACIDIGHIGIQQARTAYAAVHPQEDICSIKRHNARLPQLIEDVEKSVVTALPQVLNLVKKLAAVGKPLHFHLHDGHPLSTFSSFGVSDHLSFLTKIPIGFEYRGRHSVPLMFGPAGLTQIVATALQSAGDVPISFTLEIHPTAEQKLLGDAAPLFAHWSDQTNAEQMNHWLSVLSENHDLLQKALTSASAANSV